MLSINGRCTHQRRIEWRPKQIILFHFLVILENAISSGKKQTNKKATSACLKVYRKTHENTSKVP